MNAARKLKPDFAPGESPLASLERDLKILRALGKNIWMASQEFQAGLLGDIGACMTVIRLQTNELFIHSPIQITDEIRQDLMRLGTPRYLIGPNSNHHLFIPGYREAFPSIKLYGPPSLLKKCSDLNFYGTLNDQKTAYPWADEIVQILIDGRKNFEEVVFYHERSQTLLVTDILMRFSSNSSWFQRFARKLYGAGKGPVCMSRPIRFRLRDSMKRMKLGAWLEQLEIKQLVMSHGETLKINGRAIIQTITK